MESRNVGHGFCYWRAALALSCSQTELMVPILSTLSTLQSPIGLGIFPLSQLEKHIPPCRIIEQQTFPHSTSNALERLP